MFTADLSLYKSLNKTCNILGPELGLLLAKSTSMKKIAITFYTPKMPICIQFCDLNYFWLASVYLFSSLFYNFLNKYKIFSLTHPSLYAD